MWGMNTLDTQSVCARNSLESANDQTQERSFHLPDPVISSAQRSGVRSKWSGPGPFRAHTSTWGVMLENPLLYEVIKLDILLQLQCCHPWTAQKEKDHWPDCPRQEVSVKEPGSFLFYLPPHPQFPPPTYTFVLQNPFISWFPFPQPISIEATYLIWFYWRSQKWLTFTFNNFYSKGFPVFNHNLCANGANYDVFIEVDLLPWLRLSEIQILMKSCLGMQDLGRRAWTFLAYPRVKKGPLKLARLRLGNFGFYRGNLDIWHLAHLNSGLITSHVLIKNITITKDPTDFYSGSRSEDWFESSPEKDACVGCLVTTDGLALLAELKVVISKVGFK